MDKSNKIEWIFDEYSITDEYAQTEESAKMSAAQNSANAQIEEVIGRKTFMTIDSIITADEMACEKYGFIAGFKFAVALLTDNSGIKRVHKTDKIDIVDSITLVSDHLRDIEKLSQTIRNGYFSIPDKAVGENEGTIIYGYDKYAALYRILDDRLCEVLEQLQKAAAALVDDYHREAANINSQGGDVE